MNAESMNKANATAKIEGSKEARPPGGFPLASAPKKIFICSPYQPTANDPPCRKAQLEANIQMAKTACITNKSTPYQPPTSQAASSARTCSAP